MEDPDWRRLRRYSVSDDYTTIAAPTDSARLTPSLTSPRVRRGRHNDGIYAIDDEPNEIVANYDSWP